MQNSVSTHYSGGGGLADREANDLLKAGIEPTVLSDTDFEPIYEFHFRCKEATLELLALMTLQPTSDVLDVGCGLGGVARTIAEEAGCSPTALCARCEAEFTRSLRPRC